jgi:hypothetical protein
MSFLSLFLSPLGQWGMVFNARGFVYPKVGRKVGIRRSGSEGRDPKVGMTEKGSLKRLKDLFDQSVLERPAQRIGERYIPTHDEALHNVKYAERDLKQACREYVIGDDESLQQLKTKLWNVEESKRVELSVRPRP